MTSPATIRRRHHARGFWIIGYTFAVTMAFAGAPVPLFVIYQEREGFGTVAATIVFAAYAFGVIASLFLAGHLSDRFGRLRMIAPAVLLNVLAGLIFLTSTDLGMLIVARVLSGLGVGMLTATATAHMTELHGTARPAMGRPAGHTSAMARPAGRAPATGRPAGRAETMSTAANIGGIGAGMLVAGMLADVTPAPLHTPYLVLLFAMLGGLLLVPLVPETVSGVDGPWHYRPQRVVVPPESRAAYAGALVAGFVGFSMFGVFSGLSGAFLAGQLHITSHAVAGAVAFAAFGASVTAQTVTGGWSTRAQQTAGVMLLAAGLVLLVGAMQAVAFPVFVVGGTVTGAGAGVLFKASVGTVVAIAAGRSQAEALAGLFVASYLGMSVPVILLGVLMQVIPIPIAVLVFGAVMLALLAGASVLPRTRWAQQHE
ncbi:MFS family permease [Thermocatellispora tengchongensis]|uniref:MFS family permease n=1 Tax=Thermocatellispora tengchongensis TaxID=1073253 RepID=A0A840PDZ3_9ACTN|nr:MFS transporter [Thermocatellispora tengchongensis]MBB5134265.1 MFS family permease [Thermocatellispora tengchongensis]